MSETILEIFRNGDSDNSSTFRCYRLGSLRLELEGLSWIRAQEKLEFYAECWPNAEITIDCR